MKVLVISHMYPSRQNPTYGIFVHEQVKALAEQGCELKVLAPVPWAPWPLTALKKKWQNYAAIPAKDVLDGIEVYYPRYPVLPRSFLLAEAGYLMFRGMRQLVKGLHAEFPFDLIHAASTVFFLWILAEPMLEKLDRIKVKYGLINQ